MPRAVIVAGNRTPFVKAFSSLLELDAIDLGVEAVTGLLQRTELSRDAIDAIVAKPRGARRIESRGILGGQTSVSRLLTGTTRGWMVRQ